MEELQDLQKLVEVQTVVDGGPVLSWKCTINN